MDTRANSTATDALAAAVANFHARQPPRVWSLVVSFLGDAILPRGGIVQAGVISEFGGLAAIDAGLIRTALSRLVARGIVAREREGRKSYYRMTRAETLAFMRAADLIYGRAVPVPTGAWDIACLDRVADRTAMRQALLAEGYAGLGATTFLRPQHEGREAKADPGLLCFVAQSRDDLALLAADLWPLNEIAASYERFALRYAPFLAGSELDPAQALLARVLLVHDYRRIVLRDPFAPVGVLPDHWPAAKARAVFDAAHGALSRSADIWLDSATT